MRSVSEDLRKHGSDNAPKIADEVAKRAENVGGYLNETSSDKLLYDAESLCRQRPMAVIGGGMALGFTAARFLSASSRERSHQRQQRSQGQTPQLPLARETELERE